MSETTATSLSNRAIGEYAERVGEHHSVYDARGRANLDGLLATLGGRATVSDSMVARESLTVLDKGNFEIHLPPMTSHRRDRFTIAHELGHYFLHYLYAKESGPKLFFRGASNRAETQANVFAASLLMPSEQFKESFRSSGSDWWELAEVFGVSPRAAEVRAQVLGL